MLGPARIEGENLAEGPMEVEEVAGVVVEQATTDSEGLLVGGSLKLFKDQWAFDPWPYNVALKDLG